MLQAESREEALLVRTIRAWQVELPLKTGGQGADIHAFVEAVSDCLLGKPAQIVARGLRLYVGNGVSLMLQGDVYAPGAFGRLNAMFV